MMIAAGAAKGLEFLHHQAEPPVIFRDLKSANILLGEGFHPKLSDFGLAKFGPSGDKSHVSTRVMGTQGYCAPEYATTGKLTSKSDIYSFGVVLLELLTGRKALDDNYGRDKQLVEWVIQLMSIYISITLLKGLHFYRFSKGNINCTICLEHLSVKLAYMYMPEEVTISVGSSQVISHSNN